MFQVADLRERVSLSLASDLALRIDEFLRIRVAKLPDLDQEPHISFVFMKSKEDVIAHVFSGYRLDAP